MSQLTLDTFLKTSSSNTVKQLDIFDNEQPRQPVLIRLGILGQRRDLEEQDITEILNLIAEDFHPQSLNVCSEGNSSIYAETWAEKEKIPVKIHEADWRRNGKRAQIFRDNQIIHDSTHFLIFGGPRSERPLKTAEQLAKKGRTVYYMPYGSMELQQFEFSK